MKKVLLLILVLAIISAALPEIRRRLNEQLDG